MAKRKSLFGYGGTIRAILQREGGGWDVYDDSFSAPSTDEIGNRLLPSAYFEPSASGVEIISPGIAPSNALARKALHLQSDYDYYFDAMPKSIWISGTNGKSTTTKMTGALLGAPIGANIGTPIASMDFSAEFWVLESSSFSLHYTRRAYPMIYALLPISPDHISWHGSMDEYIRAKLSPLARMQNPCVAIIPRDLCGHELVRGARCQVIEYGSSDDLAREFGLDIGAVGLCEPFLLDAMMALSIERIVYDRASYERLSSVALAPHTLEEHIINGALWVDDSKATNEHSAIAAYERYAGRKVGLNDSIDGAGRGGIDGGIDSAGRRVLGVLGGDLKGASADELMAKLAKYNAKFYLIGSAKNALEQACKHHNCEYEICENLEHATKLMASASKDCVRLLSPACASLDEFSSYKQRGELFIAYAHKYSK